MYDLVALDQMSGCSLIQANEEAFHTEFVETVSHVSIFNTEHGMVRGVLVGRKKWGKQMNFLFVF